MAIVAIVVLLPASTSAQAWLSKKTVGLTAFATPYIETKPLGVRSGRFEFAYANCPFFATIDGEHPRQIPPPIRIELFYNGLNHDFVDWILGARRFPAGKAFPEIPHDGQVRLIITEIPGTRANVPQFVITLSPL